MALRISLLVGFALVVSLSAGRTDACSIGCETQGQSAPWDGDTVAPGLGVIVLKSSSFALPEVVEVTVRTTSGDEVPASITRTDEEIIVEAQGGFEPGSSYTVEHTDRCGGASTTFEFQTGEELPRPTALGTLAVTEVSQNEISAYNGGPCVAPLEASFATLQFTPDESVAPYLPVTRFELVAVEADGAEHPWARVSYGDVALAGYVRATWETRRLLAPHAACEDPEDGTDLGLTPGAYTLELRGFLPRETAPFAVARAPVTFECVERWHPPETADELLGCGCASTTSTSSLLLSGALPLLFWAARSRRRPFSKRGAAR